MTIERVGWSEFLERFDWQQGEHVTLVGPTGGGKTELLTKILERRQYVLLFGTKPEDDTLRRLTRRGGGFKLVRRWEDVPAVIPKSGTLRVVLWPKFTKPEHVYDQAVELDKAMRAAFTERHWCLVADELHYACVTLGLSKLIDMMWTQGRAIGISMVGACQRPRWVPLFAFSQATHLFLWRTNDEDDLKRLGGLGGLSSREIRATVAAIDRHDVLYLNTRTGQMLITNTRA